MQLEASCCCGAVRFSVVAHAPIPYLRCYCSICRKTAGSGGYAMNLGARMSTLQVEGSEHIGMFCAGIDGEYSRIERSFCRRCGTALWLRDPQRPDLVHPFAGVIDTPLPKPPEQVHAMLGAKANWVRLDAKMGERRYEGPAPQSIETWHRQHELLDEA